MRLLAVAILICTPAMLAVHLATGKLLREWCATHRSRLARKLSPRTVLRGEAVYWGMVLLGWPLWHPWALKATVALLAALHFVAWGLGESGRGDITGDLTGGSRHLRRAIIAFDLLEAPVLVVVAWLAASFLLAPGIAT